MGTLFGNRDDRWEWLHQNKRQLGIYCQDSDRYYTTNLGQICYESELMRDFSVDLDFKGPFAVVLHFIEHDHLAFD
jgi:hypothetical protein